jgi:hypothetical protein
MEDEEWRVEEFTQGREEREGMQGLRRVFDGVGDL